MNRVIAAVLVPLALCTGFVATGAATAAQERGHSGAATAGVKWSVAEQGVKWSAPQLGVKWSVTQPGVKWS